MTLFGTDLMTELRRPLRLRGPMGRRALAAVAVVSLVLVAVLAGLGAAFGSPPTPESWLVAPLNNGVTSSIDVVREPIILGLAQVGTVWLWLCGIALIPLAFAMVRRAHSTGLPLFLSAVVVILAVISALSVALAVDERIYFPLTRGLWALVTDGGTTTGTDAFGIALVFSPIFFFTVIADILLIVFVGLLAVALAVLTWGICIALCFVPTRKDLFP